MQCAQSLSRMHIAAIAIAALAGTYLMSGSRAEGASATFEYRVFSAITVMNNANLDALKQQEGKQLLMSKDPVQQISEASSNLATQIEATLNELGRDGWELAGVSDSFYVLKRPAT